MLYDYPQQVLRNTLHRREQVMADTFTLDVDQASELKHAAKRNGATNADLKVLSTGDAFAKILPYLRGCAEIVMKLFLELVATVALPALPRFVARDHFKVDPSNETKVKIAYIWPGFERFLEKVEEAVGETTVAIRKLAKDLLDEEIRKELGMEKEEITLSQFYAMLAKQGAGQAGELLTNGYANIAYIRDAEGTLWAVFAHWFAGSGGWVVSASSVASPRRWYAGFQVLSRN